jgi:hypothetical protein
VTTDPTAVDRYRRRSEAEAVQWTGTNESALSFFCSPFDFQTIDPEDRVEDPDQTAAVRTHPHGGWVGLAPGDWVVREAGRYMRASDEEFRADWEPAAGPAPATDRAALRELIAEAVRRQAETGNVRYEAIADAVLAVLPSCPDPIECSHEAALGEARQEARRLRAALAEAEERAETDDQVMDALNRTIREQCAAIERVLKFAAGLDETGRQIAGPDAVHPVAAHLRHLLDTTAAEAAPAADGAVLPASTDRTAVQNAAPVKQRADCTELEWAKQERARFERLYTRETVRADKAEADANHNADLVADAVQRAEQAEAEAERLRTDRVAVLREAADGFDAHAEQLLSGIGDKPAFVFAARQHQAAVWREAAETLRRMADETPQPTQEPHSCPNCEGVDPDTCFMNPNRPPEQCPAAEFVDYGQQCQKAVGHELHTFEETPAVVAQQPRCAVEFEGGGHCSRPAGHRTLANQDPHTPATAPAAVAQPDEEA